MLNPRAETRLLRPAPAIVAACLVALLAVASIGLGAVPSGADAPSSPAPERTGVAAPAGAAYSLWGNGSGRTKTGKPGVFGTRLRIGRDGEAVAIRFLAADGDRGKHVGRIYTSRGKVLGKVRFRGGQGAGWRTAQLDERVVLRRGRTYVVAVSSRTGLHSVGGALPARTGSLKASAGLVGRSGMPTKRSGQAQLVDVVYHPWVGPYPDASNTGAPATGLTTYDGPCTITQDGFVIDHKVVNCSLEIQAAGVLVTNSVVNGTIDSGSDTTSRYSFSLIDSTLDVSPNGVALYTGVGEVNFKVIRSEIRGGNRGINCWYRCVVRSSWVHGQDTDASGVTHESGIRMGEKARLIGNSIACDAPDVPPDAGCSAPLTGYGDFGPVRQNVIDGNLFLATTGGTCAYGGSSGGKPYSDDAEAIRFYNNVFQRGETGNCGSYTPVMDFDPHSPGNVWVGNVWADGGEVTP